MRGFSGLASARLGQGTRYRHLTGPGGAGSEGARRGVERVFFRMGEWEAGIGFLLGVMARVRMCMMVKWRGGLGWLWLAGWEGRGVYKRWMREAGFFFL